MDVNRKLVAAAISFSAVSVASAAPPDEARWLRNIRQLTNDGMGFTRAGEAYFSADGKRICFQAYPKGQSDYQIYVMNIDGSGLKMVSTGKGATTCSFFSPDGTKLIYASNHLDPRPVESPLEAKARDTAKAAPDSKAGGDGMDAKGASQPTASQPAASQPSGAQAAGKRSYTWSFFPGMDIFEYTFATGELKQLTTAAGYDAEGSYSPDGKQIIFTTMRGDDQDIWIMNADGSNQHPVVHAKGYDGGPFFSPDGKRIVYRSDRKGDESMQIFTNNLEGTDERPVTDHSTLHWCPYWHPSGKWLIYTRGDHNPPPPKYDLYLVSIDGKREFQVTTEPGFDGLPVFSPDGKQLMWSAKRNGISSAQIFIADFVGLTPAGELTPESGAK